MLTIYQTIGRGNGGFKNWSIAHPSGGDDNDHLDELTPVADAVPALGERIMAPPEQPHRPWLVQGWNTL